MQDASSRAKETADSQHFIYVLSGLNNPSFKIYQPKIADISRDPVESLIDCSLNVIVLGNCGFRRAVPRLPTSSFHRSLGQNLRLRGGMSGLSINR